MGSCRDYISIRVSLVVTAVDDFTGRSVTGGSIRVWIEGERPAVVKPEGYYVFTDIRKKKLTVNIDGGIYHRQQIPVDLEKERDTLLKVRMIPNRSYPIPRSTTCVEGRAVPGRMLFAYQTSLLQPYKLLYNYAKDESVIRIFHPNEDDIEGRTMLITGKDGMHAEVFTVSELLDSEKKCYVLPQKLQHSYRKIGTVIYPLYVIEIDKNGAFYLPISGSQTQEKENCLFFYGDDIKGGTNVELVRGRVNRIDLTGENRG